MDHHDVIVLGGGTMGTSAAWALAKAGAKALVLEQFSHVHGFGAHGGRTRIIRHAYAESPEYVPLVQRADDLWLDLERETDERVLYRTGGIELAAPGFGHARAALESAELHRLPHEWLSPAEANGRWPALTVPEDWDALFSPEAGFLLTKASLRALATASRRRGTVILEEEPARAWTADEGGVSVRTDRAIYHADRLIVTAGAWTSRIIADAALPLTLRRKTLWWLAVDDPEPFRPDRFPVFIADAAGGEIYGFPIHDHPGLKIANHRGGAETTIETIERTVRDEEKADVVAVAQRLFRGVSDRVLESTVCHYTMTPDTDFVVDRHPAHPNVVIGAGFSGHGFKFATAIGEQLAALALDAAALPIPRLSFARFAPPAVGSTAA